MEGDAPWTIRRLAGPDAAAWQALRLEALTREPEAFGAAPEDEAGRDAASVAAMLDRPPPDAVLGACDASGALLGSVGLVAMGGARQRHKALLWGLYVRPEARGRRLGAALVEAALAAAEAPGGAIEQVQLGVGVGNAAARALYRACGFRRYGLERAALRLGPGRYVDEVLMVRALRPAR